MDDFYEIHNNYIPCVEASKLEDDRREFAEKRSIMSRMEYNAEEAIKALEEANEKERKRLKRVVQLREAQKRHYEKNKEAKIAYQKKWKEKNKLKYALKQAEYYYQNREAINAKRRKEKMPTPERKLLDTGINREKENEIIARYKPILDELIKQKQYKLPAMYIQDFKSEAYYNFFRSVRNKLNEWQRLDNNSWLYVCVKTSFLNVCRSKKAFDRLFYLNSVGNGFY
jgi:glucan-binding YG repeat protein